MTKNQRGNYLAVLCCVTYASGYLGRINLSAAAGKMAIGFGVTAAVIGIIGSVQSFIYASGQLVNGVFISKWNPRLLIGITLLGSGLMNLLISFVNDFNLVTILWGINAYLQSFLWGSVVRVISVYPESSGSRSKMWLMLVLPIAYVVSWSVIGSIWDKDPDWHKYFRIPGFCLIAISVLWFTLQKFCPEVEKMNSDGKRRSILETLTYIKENGISQYCVLSILGGAIREGIFFWAPLLLAAILKGTNISPYLTVAIVPIAKVPACVLLRYVTKDGNYKRLLLILFGLIAVFCGLAIFVSANSIALNIVLIAALTLFSCMIGSSMALYIPMEYAEDNMSAPIAGMLDAMTYLGATISTFVLGNFLSSDSIQSSVAFWLVMAVIGVLILAKGKKTAQ